MSEPVRQPKSWWSRNCLWVVPVGCLGLLILAAGFVVAIGAIVMGGIKSTEAYKEAVTQAQASPEVRTALGEPIQAGWFVQGKVNVTGPTGEADLSVPLSGPQGKGRLYLTAHKRAGRWEYEVLEVAVEGRAERIHLLPSETPPPAEDTEEPDESPASSTEPTD
jgi:hypothetical protein